ncbi:ABC transporter ATP-binding protein [Lactiplantibacillus fabifermentans]|uniref:ABC transporter, ATP-binding protein n=2 Tax=Lactiplantibacillus fabifermentans TaxID=483011 RepID=A0A0R2NNT3_9LACO|nr:ABC transporter ATP-binding protein [Lactiplantibacillus fabifermentans]ETY73995.1 antibiotic ABC transporter ATP-binding protein [Lactiplantibacillus fabifermentans T30PCM01]KRO27353.1 ABC transporter, ATP-binding protein [Lactiplantibacillus fabifermentans DSM 21115]
MTTGLVVTGLTKKFGTQVAVDNVSFTVAPGTVLGLLGPNGAGKSTTINMITGLLNKTSGRVELFGENLTPTNTAIRRRFGVVPQELAIFDDLSAAENVRYFGGLYGLRGTALKTAVTRALAVVDLTDHANQRPATFSGGMQRRLNIAMAIVHQPDLLFMDEPTVGIDPQSRNYILTAIEKMRANGMTVVYTSHYMEEVERLADNIVIIDHGQVIAHGTEAELVNLVTDAKQVTIVVNHADQLELAAITAIAGVQQATLHEQNLQLVLDVASNPLNQVLMTLIDQGVAVDSIDQPKLDLETVFLNLTGRNLRD